MNLAFATDIYVRYIPVCTGMAESNRTSTRSSPSRASQAGAKDCAERSTRRCITAARMRCDVTLRLSREFMAVRDFWHLLPGQTRNTIFNAGIEYGIIGHH